MRNPTYVTLSDGSIRNTYEVRIRNMHGEDRPFRVSITGDLTMNVELEGTIYDSLTVAADEMKIQKVYIIAPPGSDAAESERVDVRIWIEDLINGDRAYKDTIFNGRAN